MTTFPLVTAHVDLPDRLLLEKDVGPQDDDGDDGNGGDDGDNDDDAAFAASGEP